MTLFAWICGPVSSLQLLLDEANNLFYKQRQFPAALEKYQECLTMLDFNLENPMPIPEAKVDKYLVPCLLGATQCCLELKQYYKAQKYCQMVLRYRPNHAKGKQLHGICCVQVGDYKSAIKAIKT